MSLHDRIINLKGEGKKSIAYRLGHKKARHDAAEMAREADELINWCEAHFETLRQIADSAASFDEAKMAIDRIKKFKEQDNDQ